MTAPATAARWSARAVAGPLGTAAALGVTVAALHFRDPHVQYSWGACPLYLATGVYCPGCGGLRAVNDITNGEFGAAFWSNALIYPAAGLLLWLWIAWLGRRVGFRVPAVPRNRWLWITVGVLVVIWTVARNLPGSPFAP